MENKPKLDWISYHYSVRGGLIPQIFSGKEQQLLSGIELLQPLPSLEDIKEKKARYCFELIVNTNFSDYNLSEDKYKELRKRLEKAGFQVNVLDMGKAKTELVGNIKHPGLDALFSDEEVLKIGEFYISDYYSSDGSCLDGVKMPGYESITLNKIIDEK